MFVINLFWISIISLFIVVQILLSRNKYLKYILPGLSLGLAIYLTIFFTILDYNVALSKGILNTKALIFDSIGIFFILNITTIVFLIINFLCYRLNDKKMNENKNNENKNNMKEE